MSLTTSTSAILRRIRDQQDHRKRMLTDEAYLADIASEEIFRFMKLYGGHYAAWPRPNSIHKADSVGGVRPPMQIAAIVAAMRALASEYPSTSPEEARHRRVFFRALRYNAVAPAVVLAERGGMPPVQVRAVLGLFDE